MALAIKKIILTLMIIGDEDSMALAIKIILTLMIIGDEDSGCFSLAVLIGIWVYL